jgi:hypothetical protein
MEVFGRLQVCQRLCKPLECCCQWLVGSYLWCRPLRCHPQRLSCGNVHLAPLDVKSRRLPELVLQILEASEEGLDELVE